MKYNQKVTNEYKLKKELKKDIGRVLPSERRYVISLKEDNKLVGRIEAVNGIPGFGLRISLREEGQQSSESKKIKLCDIVELAEISNEVLYKGITKPLNKEGIPFAICKPGKIESAVLLYSKK